jgi:hypothetical protein
LLTPSEGWAGLFTVVFHCFSFFFKCPKRSPPGWACGCAWWLFVTVFYVRTNLCPYEWPCPDSCLLK